MIQHKSVYDSIDEGDGFRLLVTRRRPRGIARDKHRVGGWKKVLGPPIDLLDDWNHGRISWDEYARRYTEYVRSLPAALQEVRAVEGE